MDKLTKTVKYNALLGLYQDLLSSTQKEILLAYYEYDLSISEIASERSISRAGVEDAIKKGVCKLDELEGKLKLYEKRENILKITAKIKQNSENKDLINDIEDIERNL